MLLIFVLIFSLPSNGQTDDSHFRKMCETNWFAEQSETAEQRNGIFLFVADSLYKEESQEFALAVIFPNDISEDAINLIFLGRKNDNENYKIINETPIPTLVLILKERLDQKKASCILPHLSPYFDATIIDLDGNGSPEVVVEANSAGTCNRCLSEVWVFEKKGEVFKKRIEESYNELEMGLGEGLIVDSYEMGPDGPVAIRKQFYTKNQE